MRTIKLLAAIQRAQLVAGSIGAAQAMLLGAMRRGAIRTWFAKVEIVRSGGGELVDRLSRPRSVAPPGVTRCST